MEIPSCFEQRHWLITVIVNLLWWVLITVALLSVNQSKSRNDGQAILDMLAWGSAGFMLEMIDALILKWQKVFLNDSEISLTF